jgi:hypothetical protein
MTEEEILASKPYTDTTLDQRAMELADILMTALRGLPSLQRPIDALPETTKQSLDTYWCSTIVKALEGKPLVTTRITDALGRPLDEIPGLLLSQQVKNADPEIIDLTEVNLVERKP